MDVLSVTGYLKRTPHVVAEEKGFFAMKIWKFVSMRRPTRLITIRGWPRGVGILLLAAPIR